MTRTVRFSELGAPEVTAAGVLMIHGLLPGEPTPVPAETFPDLWMRADTLCAMTHDEHRHEHLEPGTQVGEIVLRVRAAA